MTLRENGMGKWFLIINLSFTEIKVPLAAKMKDMAERIGIAHEGLPLETPIVITIEWIRGKKLKDCLMEDEFGVYKKPGIKIPLLYQREYKKLKRSREYQIYKKYCGLNKYVLFKTKKESFLDYIIREPSESDKIEIKKLLDKG